MSAKVDFTLLKAKKFPTFSTCGADIESGQLLQNRTNYGFRCLRYFAAQGPDFTEFNAF